MDEEPAEDWLQDDDESLEDGLQDLGESQSAPPERILITDDSSQICSALKTILTDKYPCTVKTASNGADAMKLIHNWTPDLVILDLMLPEQSGDEVLEKINNLNNHDPDVVILTGIDQDLNVEGAYFQRNFPDTPVISKSNGFDGIVEKIHRRFFSS